MCEYVSGLIVYSILKISFVVMTEFRYIITLGMFSKEKNARNKLNFFLFLINQISSSTHSVYLHDIYQKFNTRLLKDMSSEI